MEHNDHWLLIAEAGAGKSTFARQMSPEYLVIDTDVRWSDQAVKSDGKSHIIASSDPIQIQQEMNRLRNELQDKIGTVILDSGTFLLAPIVARGQLANANSKRDTGKGINMDAVMQEKAATMRIVVGSMLSYHKNTLLIFHHEESGMSGKMTTRSTLPKAEYERLKKAIHATLTVTKANNGMRGIQIEWTHDNPAAVGQVVWDYDGMWKNVPQKLHTFLRHFTGSEGYNGKSYDPNWLLGFLASKGVVFTDVPEMAKKLEVTQWPYWFDRLGWGESIKRAGVQV